MCTTQHIVTNVGKHTTMYNILRLNIKIPKNLIPRYYYLTG